MDTAKAKVSRYKYFPFPVWRGMGCPCASIVILSDKIKEYAEKWEEMDIPGLNKIVSGLLPPIKIILLDSPLSEVY